VNDHNPNGVYNTANPLRVGMIGLGKLGYPIATCLQSLGHDVMGYDVCEREPNDLPFKEEGFRELAEKHLIRIAGSIEEVTQHSNILFVAVQTPNDSQFEGITVLPAHRQDFDYTYLEAACKEIGRVAVSTRPTPVVAIISTVLPGATKRYVFPHINPKHVVYNPSFIAMGTVIHDFLHPEFVLLGSENQYINEIIPDESALGVMYQFYRDILVTFNGDPVIHSMSVESAELTKVAYNTFIGQKITFANAIMEISSDLGCNCDDVMNALKSADKRLISTAYMTPGMGDGGGCFPADEKIMTEHGPMPIYDTIEGDKVLTIDGTFQSVLRVWIREYDDEIIGVKVAGSDLETWMTKCHPVMAATLGEKWSSLGKSVREVEAEKLCEDDYIPWPIGGIEFSLDPDFFHQVFKSPEDCIVVKGSIYRPVKSISRRHHIGKVYNLWVGGTNTYVVSCGAVHNCHPRDQIALSWLARELGMSYDPFESVMKAREEQARWLCKRLVRHPGPYGILGVAFKANSDMITGSAALLCVNILRDMGHEPILYDPWANRGGSPADPYEGNYSIIDYIPKDSPCRSFLVGMNHDVFQDPEWSEALPDDAIVVDPWGDCAFVAHVDSVGRGFILHSNSDATGS